MIENKFVKIAFSIFSFLFWSLFFCVFVLEITSYQEFLSAFNIDKLRVMAIAFIGPVIVT